MKKPVESIFTEARSEVTLRSTDNVFSKSDIWVERQNFYGRTKGTKDDTYLIVGFDTEFKTPAEPVSRDGIKAGEAKYQVLSYQVHCSVYDPAQPAAQEWSGICYPNDGERLSLSDILIFAAWKGIQSGAVSVLPTRVYLVGHFTKADMPALSDFQDLTEMMSSVRNTFLSLDSGISVKLGQTDGGSVELLVILRDTMLLTPAASKSLATLGDLVGLPKIILDPDPALENHFKENMDQLLRDRPEAFEEYAINDAVICVRYLEQLIDQCEEILGKRKVPATLSSIGVDLLLKAWIDAGFEPLDILGKEKIETRYFSKRLGHYVKKKEDVDVREVDRHVRTATECYHGGRNEQFWFGPAFEDDWTDYDLAGAYPTAMSMIGKPDWRSSFVSMKLRDYTADTLGVAEVEFEFPKKVRFPTMPVRTENGLVFPRKGVSDCAAPEIAVAKALGAKLKIRHGVIVPTDPSVLIFGEFIKDCVAKRQSFKKGTLKNLFWKEVTNSTYGKTAQGLLKKRVFDLRDREMKELPPSKVTNPFFAAYITSFVRGTLGEVMNALPPEVCVFSCTTDGFLTNATPDQMAAATCGKLSGMYHDSRFGLTGVREMLEIKHQVRKPLGWRTRGQATLVEGKTDKGDDTNIVLAKGGIWTTHYLREVRPRNDYIVDLFAKREPTTVIPTTGGVGIREMVEFDTDFVEKVTSKRLNMEFDWKRRPSAVWFDTAMPHVAFATQPWDTIDEFTAMRAYWEQFGIDSPRCIKTVEDFRALAVHVLSKSALADGGSAYLRKSDPDIKRLRQVMCGAWKKSAAGLTYKEVARTADQFAVLLTEAGVPCKRSDVENYRQQFVPQMCPKTPAVMDALKRLRRMFPSLQVDQIVSPSTGIDMLRAIGKPTPFLPQGAASPELLEAAE